jgi:hypothetical protein
MEVEVMVTGVNDGTNKRQVGIKQTGHEDWSLQRYFRTLL